MQIEFVKYVLNFNRPATTSRDTLYQREIFYLILRDPDYEGVGIGECAPIFGLSAEIKSDFMSAMLTISKASAIEEIPQNLLVKNPSIRFALETAFLDLKNGANRQLFLLAENLKIPINGLIWMNDKVTMLADAFKKIEDGYDCIKLKIGGLNFKDELEILKAIRSNYSAQKVQIRLDANGAFQPDEALTKLEKLSQFDIHSIEQPIKPAQWNVMKQITEKSPIAIALDEELITTEKNYEEILDATTPHYLVLKPTLHGGISGCDQWIKLANDRNIKWWATSALESNIGLNAIAQWVSTHQHSLHQGLGTGQLFVDNITSPLQVAHGYLWWNINRKWRLDSIIQY